VKGMNCAGWDDSKYALWDFTASVSFDNVNWTVVDSVDSNTQGVVDRTIIPVFCRYIRISTDGMEINPGLASIVELEVYDLPCPNLQSLTLSSGTLSPAFEGINVFKYTALVNSNIKSVNLTSTAMDSATKVMINGAVVESGMQSQPIDIDTGCGNIITVSAVNSISHDCCEYLINVVKASSPYISSIEGLPAQFEKETVEYTFETDNNILSLKPVLEDTKAGLLLNAGAKCRKIASGTGVQILLNPGFNAFSFFTTSSIGVQSVTYKFYVTYLKE
jgi:hypothetical protein